MAKISPLMVAPPLIFAGFVALAFTGMFRADKDVLPSQFIGQPAPQLPEEPLPGYPLLTPALLAEGDVTVVNFWASWCPPCRAEHPYLLELAASGVRVAGVNFKDEADQAIRYLEDDGNPFFAIGYDPAGRKAIDWGVTAPPETFIIDGEGKVLYKFIGPLVGSALEQQFMPELRKALAGE
ncbi:MAG: DsbE family thiol:disulfide interchange protein [Arenibacterium sp.]